MKRFFKTLAVGLTLSMVTSAAQATLIDRGNGMIYDQDLDITWVSDANLFKTQFDADNSMLNNLFYQYVDNHSHMTNYRDFVTATGSMSWWGAQAWVDNLVYGGFDDWRLPTTLQADSSCSSQYPHATGTISYSYNCSGSELGHLFYDELGGTAGSPLSISHNANYNLFSNINWPSYWSGTEYAPYTAKAWEFKMDGHQYAYSKDIDLFYAWAVRDGDVALVSSGPIPAPEPNDPVAAVPEPGVLGLFTLGLVGLMGFRRGRYNLKKTLQLISAGLAFNLVATTAYAGPMLLPGQTISIPGGSLIIVGDFGSLNSDIIWAVSDPQGSGAGQPEVGSDVGVENQGTAASIAASLLLLDSLNNTSNQSNSNNNAPLFDDTPQATSTAVPEPSVLGLFTLGLMGLMGVKRRRTV